MKDEDAYPRDYETPAEARLYEQVGTLQVALEWMKKELDRLAWTTQAKRTRVDEGENIPGSDRASGCQSAAAVGTIGPFATRRPRRSHVGCSM